MLRIRVPSARSDEDLIEAAAAGDGQALSALYDRYAAAVYALALGIVRNPEAAKEVTQEVFLSFWRRPGRFDRSRGSGRAWLLSLAHHRAVDVLRRNRVRHANSLTEEAAASDEDWTEEVVRSLEGARVREALAALPEAQREALVLAYYGGLTQREIAERLGIPLGTVKTRMRDGLLRLRALLGGGRDT
jgi:RNA polymerase sigma-70 factor (ECF subfamily)